jgi:hypothetical protein
MPVFPEDLQLPVDVAEEELHALSQEQRGSLLEWLDAVFLYWKGQEGQQPVIGYRCPRNIRPLGNRASVA